LNINLGTEQVVQRVQGWHQLHIDWQGGQEEIKAGLPFSVLQRTWQLLVLGDGSTTRHLQLLTGEPIVVDVIDMSLVGDHPDDAPELIQAIQSPRLRRQVWLRTQSGQRLAYATSWWEANHVDEYLHNRSLPIWSSLAHLRLELYRDVRQVFVGQSESLSAGFGQAGNIWGRNYLFWHDGKPITLIYEVFSPVLERYIGAMSSNMP
jgi:chorismate lyase